MFGTNNFLVVGMLNDVNQQEMRKQAEYSRLLNEAAGQQPGLWHRTLNQVGKVSVSLGQWLQTRASAPVDVNSCYECV